MAAKHGGEAEDANARAGLTALDASAGGRRGAWLRGLELAHLGSDRHRTPTTNTERPPISTECIGRRSIGGSRFDIDFAHSTIGLISPPWFSAEMDQQGARYFQSQGFELVYNGPAGLPSDQQAIEPNSLYEWVRTHTPESAEAVFIGGNGFRAIGTIKVLEENLNRPILTANQVAFWQALQLSGAVMPVVGYGQIFSHGLPASVM